MQHTDIKKKLHTLWVQSNFNNDSMGYRLYWEEVRMYNTVETRRLLDRIRRASSNVVIRSIRT